MKTVQIAVLMFVLLSILLLWPKAKHLMGAELHGRAKLLTLAWPQEKCAHDWNLASTLFQQIQVRQEQGENRAMAFFRAVHSKENRQNRLWRMEFDNQSDYDRWKVDAASGKPVPMTVRYAGNVREFTTVKSILAMSQSLASDLGMQHHDNLYLSDKVRDASGFTVAMTVSNPYMNEGQQHTDLPRDLSKTLGGVRIQNELGSWVYTNNYMFITFVLYLHGGTQFSSVAPGLMSTVVSDSIGDTSYSVQANKRAKMLNSSSFKSCQMSVFPSHVSHSIGPNPGDARAAIACKLGFARGRGEKQVTWDEIYDWLQSKSGMTTIGTMSITPADLAAQYGVVNSYPAIFGM
jgi:hypothetical protein